MTENVIIILICVFVIAAAEENRTCSGENEIWTPHMAHCKRTCANPDPLCPAMCAPGCTCILGHVRNTNDICIPLRNCSSSTKTTMADGQSSKKIQCSENEVFTNCDAHCQRTCTNPSPPCSRHRQCIPGCCCKIDYVRNAQGQCIPLKSCPSLGPVDDKKMNDSDLKVL